jgi:hybrid cluster-associated redox disulfide protein
MLVADVLAGNPVAARVFIARRMGCVGCAFAPFETISEAARAYGIEPGDLARSLADAVAPAPASALSLPPAPGSTGVAEPLDR